MIRRIALETPGVDYLPRQEAVGLLGEDGGVGGVELRDRAGGLRRVRARLVVGADGRNSRIARLAGARERRAANQRFCYMAYYTGVGLPAGSGGRFWALDPDVAIASPNDDGLTVLAAFLHKRRLPEFSRDRGVALRELFGSLPQPPALDGAEIAGKVLGYTNYELVARDVTPRAGVALVGDAALTSDPLMAIGCGWALQSAAWLTDSVTSALAQGEPAAVALRGYMRTHRRRLTGHHRMLAADARGHRMNPVQRLLFSAAARDPHTAARFHRYAERSIPPRRLLAPGALARAARVNVSPRQRPAAAALARMSA